MSNLRIRPSVRNLHRRWPTKSLLRSHSDQNFLLTRSTPVRTGVTLVGVRGLSPEVLVEGYDRGTGLPLGGHCPGVEPVLHVLRPHLVPNVPSDVPLFLLNVIFLQSH